MKKSILLILAATAMALFSCQKETPDNPNENPGEKTNPGENTNENTGEDFSKKPITIEASLSADGVSWVAGDALVVTCADQAYNFSTAASGATADFTTTGGLTQEKVGANPLSAYFGCTQFGVFSIAQHQTIAGAASQTKLPMYAYTTTAPDKARVKMAFTPAASLLEITLTPADITLNKVEILPVDETGLVGTMAGQGSVNPVLGEVKYAGDIKSLDASFAEGVSLKEGLTFTMPVGWFSVSGGVKVVLTYNDTNTYEELLWDAENFQSYTGSGDAKAFKKISVNVEVVVGARDFFVAPDGKASSKGNKENDPTTLDYALSSAEAGSVIHLAAGTYNPVRNLAGDATGDDAHKTFEIARGLTLVGAGAGKTILDAAGAYHAVCVTALPEEKVVLKDLTIQGGDNSTAEKETEESGFVLSPVNEKQYLDRYGTGLYVIGSDVELENVKISGNNGQNAAGAYFKAAKAHLKNTEVSGNTSSGNGCGVWVAASELSVEGGAISNNIASGTAIAAGLYIYADEEATATATVSDCILSGNEAPGNGGGLYVRGANETAHVNAVFTNCAIQENKGNMGSGFVVTYATVTFDGCKVLKNTSAGNGGNYVYAGASVTVKDCVFRENTATLAAAIYEYTDAAAVELTVLGSEFSANTTAGRGGALYARCNSATGAKLNVANSTLFGNQAASTGSAIALYAADGKPLEANIYSSTITGNTCTRSSKTPGGAIGLETAGITAHVYNCVVSGNIWEANAEGADLFKKAGTVTSHKCIIGSTVTDADGADVAGAPAFDAATMLSKKAQDGKTTVFSLSGSDNPAKTYGYDAAGLKGLGASIDATILGIDQWGNARTGSVMGAYVE